ncbi:MAG: type I restriction enzyme HsdR N-terminal domain-containing protein [Pedobacter sp.]|nr:MAG: type I restriction enzyme HsdR N-terminal domain-containing protein [Pedobacter sp.]
MTKLPALNLKPQAFKITQEGDKLYIFDEIRKKHLLLSPEEWVRQHFIRFLIQEKNIPSTLIQIEGGLKLNQLQKRSDILILDTYGNPLILVECKAPKIKITQSTFDQAARYNSIYKAPILIVTNGLQHIYAEIQHNLGQYKYLPDLPLYSEILANKKKY